MKQLNENIKAILAISALYMSLIYFFAVTFFENKADPQIIIAIIAINNMSYGYFFSSSSSGAKKDEMISNMAKNIPTQVDKDIPQKVIIQEKPIKVDVIKKEIVKK